MDNEELKIGDKVRLKGLFLRNRWNGYIVNISQRLDHDVFRIKELEESDELSIVFSSRLEKVSYYLPEHLFEID